MQNKIYKLVWKFGKEEYTMGQDIVDACRMSGIGNGALPALDYWDEVKELPDHLKVFEWVSDNVSQVIHNPHFIERLKQTGFEIGNVTEIRVGHFKFTYKYIGKTPTAFLFESIVVGNTATG